MKLLNRFLNSVGSATNGWMQQAAESKDSCLIIELPHHVDSSNAEAVGGMLSKAAVRPGMTVVIDSTNCHKLDSSGIGALVEQRNRFVKEGVDLVIAASNERVRHVLHITRLDTLIPIYRTLEEAVSGAEGGEAKQQAARA